MQEIRLMDKSSGTRDGSNTAMEHGYITTFKDFSFINSVAWQQSSGQQSYKSHLVQIEVWSSLQVHLFCKQPFRCFVSLQGATSLPICYAAIRPSCGIHLGSGTILLPLTSDTGHLAGTTPLSNLLETLQIKSLYLFVWLSSVLQAPETQICWFCS